MDLQNITSLAVPWADRTLYGDCLDAHGECRTLVIHGAGTSERGRHLAMRRALQRRGIGSVAFDCLGHGETGGSLADSSLARRTEQARAVWDAAPPPAPRAVIGSSMGAYNALRLLETHPVEALVLVVPGIYTPDAYALPFGPDFSAVIRRERSWADSDAWDILAGFTGRLLVLAAGQDTVIPAEIPERLYRSAERAAWRRLQVVPDAAHNHFFSLLTERPPEFERTIDLLAECLGGRA